MGFRVTASPLKIGEFSSPKQKALRMVTTVKNRIFFKLLAVFLIVIVATAVILDVMLGGAWEASLRNEIERNLTQKTLLFAHRVEIDRAHSLAEIAAQEGQAAGARATIIDASGKVLADSEANPPTWRTTRAARNSPRLFPARQARTSAAAPPSAFLFSMSPRPSPEAPCASPIRSPMSKPFRRRCIAVFSGALRAFLIALLIAGAASVWTSRRLERIVDVAARIERGDLRARVEDSPLDEIGRVAAAIDKTAGQVERSFAAVRSSQRQLETLLNSMQDAVIAVSSDGLVQWANQPMDRLVPQRTRLNAPVVETIRDPDFLAAVKAATSYKEVKTARATSIVPGRAFDVTAAPLPDGGAVAVLRDLTETERVEKTRRDFIANVSHELRTPLTSIQGYSETLLDTLRKFRRSNPRISGNHPQERRPHGAPHRGLAHSGARGVRRNALRNRTRSPDRTSARRRREFPRDRPRPGSGIADRRVAADHGSRGSVESLPLVLADREAIHQVFSNLIDNAMKYGRSGAYALVLGAPPPLAVRTASNSMCRISAPASPPNTCRAFSNASTASTKPAPANPAAPDSASPSPSTSCSPTAAPSAPKANSATAAPSSSPSPPRKSCAENLSRDEVR